MKYIIVLPPMDFESGLGKRKGKRFFACQAEPRKTCIFQVRQIMEWSRGKFMKIFSSGQSTKAQSHHD